MGGLLHMRCDTVFLFDSVLSSGLCGGGIYASGYVLLRICIYVGIRNWRFLERYELFRGSDATCYLNLCSPCNSLLGGLSFVA